VCTQERRSEHQHPLYRALEPGARCFKIGAQMLIGLLIVLGLFLQLVLLVICQTDQFFAQLLFGEPSPSKPAVAYPLELVGFGLVLAAVVELAYMLFTEEPDEALDPLLMGLAAATLLTVAQIKTDAAGWRIALLILVLSAAVGFLFFIRYAYPLTPRRRNPQEEEELRTLVERLERAESTLKAHINDLDRKQEELEAPLEEPPESPRDGQEPRS
jgi:hypothetical protein